MAEREDSRVSFEEDDHRAAFIFNPASGDIPPSQNPASARPVKRRKIAKSAVSKPQDEPAAGPAFPPLFHGAESPAAVKLRRELFDTAWPVLEDCIQRVLRDANRTTLDEVTAFLQRAAGEDTGKITAGFIITGPNIASQDLLFEQLGETLCTATQARFVRLRASEAPNLKAALKKIIRDATARGEDEEDGDVEVTQGGRKHLDYDLESLHVFLSQEKQQSCRVVVAFQDSEAFESGLLTDLITLFHSWRDRIRFDILFGVATSVELFQARLLKSTARQLHGAQFDVVQVNSVLESVIKSAVAGSRARLRIGPSLLRSLVERQQDQVAGIQMFISSLKYAYMCHFYANPLSVLLAAVDDMLPRDLLQPEHIEAVRTLDSFKAQAEAAVEARQLSHAQSLIQDDEYLIAQILEQGQKRHEYQAQLLRSLHLITSSGLTSTSFTELYIMALSSGIDIDQASGTVPLEDAVRRLNPEELAPLIGRLLDAIRRGSPELGLKGWESDAEELVGSLTDLRDEVEGLVERSKSNGTALKSKYSAQSRVMRTTVVAQKVQLSRDTATLTEEDKEFTQAIDALLSLLSQNLQSVPVDNLFLHEAWVFDSKSPYRDVFVPRPGGTFGRALSRPHDYLACACCAAANGGTTSTLPTTAILYHLYLEAGALINVADLWAAYYALVGDESDIGLDERSALVRFYSGLAELRLMGFVKQSKKKADHIAKLKWL